MPYQLPSSDIDVHHHGMLSDASYASTSSLGPLQFTNQYSWSTTHAISLALHLLSWNTWIRETPTSGVIDCNSVLNTIISSTLITKLMELGGSPRLGKWIVDFLTNIPQLRRIGNKSCYSIILYIEKVHHKDEFSAPFFTPCIVQESTNLIQFTHSRTTPPL